MVAFIMQGLSVIAIYSMGNFDMSNTVRIFTLAPLMFIFVWFGSIIFKLVDNRLFNRLMLYFLISFAAYILIITIYNT